MRKTVLGTFLKKVILVLVLIAVVLVGSIFLIDQYRGSTINQADNKYSDEYWQKLDGFKHYSEWEKPTLKYNLNTKEYESPFKSNFTITEILAAARYDEELNKVTMQYRAELSTIGNDIELILKSFVRH